MPDDNLTLENVYRMFSPLYEVTDRAEKTDVIERVRKVLQSNSDGVLSPDALHEEHSNIMGAESVASVYSSKSENNDYMYFCGESSSPVAFGSIIGVQGKENKFCVVMVHEQRITPMTDNTAPIEKFLNFMPPIVMSMCSPYIDIEFINTRSAQSDGAYLLAPSTLKFLLGGAKIDSLGDYTKLIASADINTSGETQVSKSGLELFTAPQTLQNFDDTHSNRYLAPLDMFRPLATLENVVISSRGTTGILSYKTAQIQMKIHDKARLSEFADVLQPISAPNTSIILTYGWRHPDDESPYGKFINEHMYVREAYGLINSSFSFDAAGQVSVTISLSAKGATGLHNMTLAAAAKEDQFAIATADWIELSKKIASWKARYLGTENEDGRRDLLGYTLIDSAAAMTFPDMNSSEVKSALSALSRALSKVRQNDSEIKELIDNLNRYYVKRGKGFEYAEKVKQVANTIVKKKFEALRSNADPFLVSTKDKLKKIMDGRKSLDKTALNRYENALKEIEQFKKSKSASGIVSFGKIVTTMLCPALVKLENQKVSAYELFFYNVNDRAGHASGINLAEFPIDVGLFKTQYEQYLETVATETITIEQFIKLVVDSQISDFRAIPYGFRNVEGVVSLGTKKDTEPAGSLTSAGATQYPFLSLGLNENRGEFIMPQVEVHLETRPARSSSNDETVLRIHIFDKMLKPHPEEKFPIYADNLNSLGRREVLDKAQRFTPLLVPGMNSSAIFDVSVSTKNNAQLQASQMIRMNSGRNVQATPRGSGVGGLPLSVTPVALTMKTIGCPVINYAQMFFVDMNTGTTIDNRYGVVNLTHDIKPGSFVTSLQLALYDSYAKFYVADLEKDSRNSLPNTGTPSVS